MGKSTRFFVPGIPAPGGSKRAFIIGGRARLTDACERNKPWRQSVAMFAMAAHRGALFTGPLLLDVEFVMPRIKSHFRTGKNAGQIKPNAPMRHTFQPDATKLLRALEDALTGIVWRDDAQVCIQHVSKIYGEKPGAHVEVMELDESVVEEAEAA
jgi:Holliday junction resolvase RusA-like endonuclease